jgi:hypothetical protein
MARLLRMRIDPLYVPDARHPQLRDDGATTGQWLN